MLDPLAAFVFSLTTAFALTVDVCVYAVAAFVARPRPRDARRFAFEVGVAHAAFLSLGALAAEGMSRALGSDLVVDVVASVALLVVLRGAWIRARNGPAEEADEAKADALSWFTAFALSVDAFLLGPTANEFAAGSTVGARLALSATIFVLVFAFAWTYASFAKVLNRWFFSRAEGGTAFLIASAAEIIVFSVFLADAAFAAFAHAGSPIGDGGARLIGAGFGFVLFIVARCGARASREVEP